MKLRAPALLFTNAAGQLLEDPAGFVRVHWGTQPRSLPDTQALLNQVPQQLQRQQESRILINQVGMRPFTPTEQQWIAYDWLPRAVQLGGYRHGAVVVSPDVLVRLSTAYITTNVQGLPLVYRSFDGEAEAVRWLLERPSAPSN